MHHKKKRKLFVLYSIPIINNLCNKFNRKKYLVSYSIPLSCMVVLLLGGIMMINPNLSMINKTNAVTIRDEWVVTDNSAVSADEFDESSSEDVTETVHEESNSYNKVHEAITPSSILINVAGQDQSVATEVTLGEVAYRDQMVSIKASNVQSCTVLLSGDSVLTPPTADGVVLQGANNVIGSNLENNTWGYAWDAEGVGNDKMTYKTPVPTGAILEQLNASAENDVLITKKLAFAAKFPTTTRVGNYVNDSITLSVIATPLQTTSQWKDVEGNAVPDLATTATTMQSIESGFCKENDAIKTGYMIELDDVRDNNTYTIVKLGDGNCWMQENLRLSLTEEGLSYIDTDLPEGENWNSSSAKAPTVTLEGADGAPVSGWRGDVMSATYHNVENGNYYSWCAATAGSCNDALNVNNMDARSSICPKGWRLPSANDFLTLFGNTGVNMGATDAFRAATLIQQLPYKFPVAGYISYMGGYLGMNDGEYWSSTHDTNGYVKMLHFSTSYNGTFYPQEGIYMHNGLSVRCVASY